MKKRFEFFNHVVECVFNADKAEEPVEITVYDAIGKDPWSGRGMSSGDFHNVLAEACPNKDRDLSILLNSKGGDVHEGLAIRNELESWPKNVTGTITGVAASTASWLLPQKAKIRAFKNSQMFIHDAMAFGGGTADDLRKVANKLDIASNQIAGMYSERNGKTPDEMRRMMKETKLMTGQEAKNLGLVDEIVDGSAARNFAPEELVSMKNQIQAIYNSVAPKAPANNQQKQTMTREQMLALLKTHGVTVANEATDEQLTAALEQLLNAKKTDHQPGDKKTDPQPAPELATILNEIKSLKKANQDLEQARVTGEIEKLVNNDQLTPELKAEAIRDCVANPDRLVNFYQKLPVNRPGAAPIGAIPAEASEDVRNVMKGMQSHIITGISNADKMVTTAAERSAHITNIWRKERENMIAFLNATTITIPVEVKRIAILNETIRAYAKRVLPLRVFATVFGNVPLQGTDEVTVQYFPLQTGASKDWDGTKGYEFDGTAVQMAKKILVDKRKYQPLDYGSDTFRRQPFFNAVQLGEMNAEKLGYDCLLDILSIITAAKFGASVKTIDPAAVDSDDIIDIQGAVNALNWPDAGRGLIVDSTINTQLQKDPTYKLALNIAGTEVVRGGKLPNISGFNYAWMPAFPANAEKLVGIATHMSGMGVAFSPVDPVAEVRSVMSAYEVVTEPETGISMNYRAWGNAQMDRAFQVIETAYGKDVINPDGIKRIDKV